MKSEYLRALPLTNIRINDVYWNRYTKLITEKAIPYQWEVLNDRVADALPSYCLHNFRIAAGEITGERKGTVFQDSDAAKWLEAVAYSLASSPDPELEKNADDLIDLIGRAQCEDGYIDTYFMLMNPEGRLTNPSLTSTDTARYTMMEAQGRWSNLTEGHELYCAGHLIEAAVAYYEVAGKKNLLDIACRLADLLCKVFGPAENQIHGCPGHPEIELALVRLYHATNESKYLDLAAYFVDVRGASPNYFLEEMARPDFHHIYNEFLNYDPAYSQSHVPVREQNTAEGHAVRAVYLYSAMVDIAALKNDEQLLNQCKTLWNNIVEKRMYITGSIGSSGLLERFTTDYDLPNDSNYSETCASIGLALFGLRMSRITKDASYIDTVEKALYNTVRAGISMEGDRYFYVNPLEVWPHNCITHTSRSHVKPVRQKWFDVACCPTNIARTFSSLGQYIYSVDETEIYLNLFISNNVKLEINGTQIDLAVNTDYPRTGNTSIEIKNLAASSGKTDFTFAVRVPSFAENFTVLINGESAEGEIVKGYYKLQRKWESGDKIDVSFDVRPRIVYANPLVRANSGKIAIVRGPEVYCFEEVDNGENLSAVYLSADTELSEEWKSDLLGGTMIVRCNGKKFVTDNSGASFSSTEKPRFENITLIALPYGSWANRKPGEMIVWIHELM
jgi:DUF1680 family protein